MGKITFRLLEEKDFNQIHIWLNTDFVIEKFLHNHVFNNNLIDKCIIGLEPKNISAILMCEKYGFKWCKNYQIDEDVPIYLMELINRDFVART